MNADNIMQADLNDIIFENRNKEYGAYDLRRKYSERLVMALTIVFFLMALFSMITFFKKNNILTVETILINDPAPVKIIKIKRN
ncbi:MAG: hypothetical protein WKF35_11355 [Ferruginibacter sp.]